MSCAPGRVFFFFFFFKQKTAYEMRISDWSSDVCSSDLAAPEADAPLLETVGELPPWAEWIAGFAPDTSPPAPPVGSMIYTSGTTGRPKAVRRAAPTAEETKANFAHYAHVYGAQGFLERRAAMVARSEEHTSELQSLMRLSY